MLASSPALLPSPGRATCRRCDRPAFACLCGAVPRLANRTPVLLLQHPRERRHPLGTARLLRLGLERLAYRVCWQVATAPPPAPAGGARVVLYPRAGAPMLAPTMPVGELVVLDGTWSQARALHRENRWLHALPHVAIRPDGIDRYRLRREPAAHCTSTVEAVVHALAVLEPETTGLDDLLAAFAAMIDRQLPFVGRAGRRRRPAAGPRPGTVRRRALWAEAAERGVVVYGEVIGSDAGGCGSPRPARELAVWAAHHLGSGRTWICERALAGGRQLTAPLRRHMGREAATEAPLDDAALAAAWRAWAPADPIVIAWNDASLRLCHAHVAPGARTAQLKTLYCNATGRHGGALDGALARHGLTPAFLPAAGRAALRLGQAVALARFLAASA